MTLGSWICLLSNSLSFTGGFIVPDGPASLFPVAGGKLLPPSVAGGNALLSSSPAALANPTKACPSTAVTALRPFQIGLAQSPAPYKYSPVAPAASIAPPITV